MSSPSRDNEEPSSSTTPVDEGSGASAGAADARPPAKRRLSSTVIEISDTESDDSDVCAVNSYQASADEVKRIRGEDYSSSSSSSDYSSDSEASWEDDSILVEDDKSHVKAVKAQLNPRANRMDDPKLNPSIKSQELIERLQTHWSEQKDLKTPEVTLTCEPFRLCLLHDFLANPEMINNIVDDMNTLDWSRKKMDLFEFHQTADLASLTWQRSIRGIYELLKTEVMSWVSSVTGLTLRSVSASCSLYGPGDHLLVHDDLLADRRVAFILYLAPWRPPQAPLPARTKPVENGDGDHHEWGGWAGGMGGALQLLARDGRGPTRVAHSVCPRNNMLAFFKVGTDSFHQVEEVLSLELPRLSINGWFHGPAPPGEAPAPDAEPEPASAPDHSKPHSDIVRTLGLVGSHSKSICHYEHATPDRLRYFFLYSSGHLNGFELAIIESDKTMSHMSCGPWSGAAEPVGAGHVHVAARARADPGADGARQRGVPAGATAARAPGRAGAGAGRPRAAVAGGGPGQPAPLPARVPGVAGRGARHAPGARRAQPVQQRRLRAPAGRLHGPGAGGLLAPGAAALGAGRLLAAAAARRLAARAPGRAAARARRARAGRGHAVRGARGGGGRGRGRGRGAGGRAARAQRAGAGVRGRGRGGLHEVREPPDAAARAPLLRAGRHVPRVTAVLPLSVFNFIFSYETPSTHVCTQAGYDKVKVYIVSPCSVATSRG